MASGKARHRCAPDRQRLHADDDQFRSPYVQPLSVNRASHTYTPKLIGILPTRCCGLINCRISVASLGDYLPVDKASQPWQYSPTLRADPGSS
jgi:hypothetical protein